MKEQYFEAEMEIADFCVDDVITTSSAYIPPSTDGRGNENEGPAGDAFL